MKYLLIITSFIFCNELEFYLNTKPSEYDSYEYNKTHNIKRITTEYKSGIIHEIIYHYNGVLKSKGYYVEGMKIQVWKYCDNLYKCYCVEYDHKGNEYETDKICE